MTRLLAGRWRNQGSNSGGGKSLDSGYWGPRSLPANKHRGIFPRGWSCLGMKLRLEVCGAVSLRPHTAWRRGEHKDIFSFINSSYSSANSKEIEHCINYINEQIFPLFTFTHDCKSVSCGTIEVPHIPAHSHTTVQTWQTIRRRYLTAILKACQTEMKGEIWISSPFWAFCPLIMVLGW